MGYRGRHEEPRTCACPPRLHPGDRRAPGSAPLRCERRSTRRRVWSAGHEPAVPRRLLARLGPCRKHREHDEHADSSGHPAAPVRRRRTSELDGAAAACPVGLRSAVFCAQKPTRDRWSVPHRGVLHTNGGQSRRGDGRRGLSARRLAPAGGSDPRGRLRELRRTRSRASGGCGARPPDHSARLCRAKPYRPWRAQHGDPRGADRDTGVLLRVRCHGRGTSALGHGRIDPDVTDPLRRRRQRAADIPPARSCGRRDRGNCLDFSKCSGRFPGFLTPAAGPHRTKKRPRARLVTPRQGPQARTSWRSIAKKSSRQR